MPSTCLLKQKVIDLTSEGGSGALGSGKGGKPTRDKKKHRYLKNLDVCQDLLQLGSTFGKISIFLAETGQNGKPDTVPKSDGTKDKCFAWDGKSGCYDSCARSGQHKKITNTKHQRVQENHQHQAPTCCCFLKDWLRKDQEGGGRKSVRCWPVEPDLQQAY